jgi:hypothetical protein
MRLGLVLLLCVAGCAKNHGSVKEATVDEVAQWLEAGTATVFDANNASFRSKYGTVTGAVLLDSYQDYDLKVLGEDKSRQLVFYCSNRL